jgi:uncharacterized protein (TIGR02996 family)
MYPGWPLRYFELANDKFWEITLEEKAITTRHGKIGSPGQTKRRGFGAGYEAKAESRRLVAEKLKQGYVEKVPGVTTPAAKTNAALEKAISRDPYDDAAYMVYGDWLQARDEPRGELIALAAAGKAKAAAKCLAAHADYFLGPLKAHQECHDGFRDKKRPAFTWKNGFIFGARLAHNQYADNWPGVLATDVLLPLLLHPSGKFLVELTINENDDPSEDTLDDLFAVIAGHPIPTLRKLRIGDEVSQISWYRVGKVGAIWKAVPKLTHFEIEAGEFELGTIELPHLTRAVFHTGGLSKESATSIARARWPKLEHLEVYFGDPEYGCTATLEHALSMLERTDLEKLSYLGIKNAEFQGELIPHLAGSKLVRQLHTLDMSCGILLDEHVDLLLAHADAFRHLEVLDVSSTWLTDKAIKRLRGVARTIKAENCWNDPDPEFRYVRVGE